jgi:hypothetical protein
MAHLPKKLLQEARDLPGLEAVRSNAGGKFHEVMHEAGLGNGRTHFLRNGVIDGAAFDLDKYYALAEKILNHTREHASTEAMVAYMLKALGVEEPRRVLVVSRIDAYDYTDLTVLSGLSGLGIQTTVVSKRRPTLFQLPSSLRGQPRRARDAMLLERVNNAPSMVGAGFQFAFRLDPRVVDPDFIESRDDAVLKRRILDGEFDVILFAKASEGPTPYLAEARSRVAAERAAGIPYPTTTSSSQRGGGLALGTYVWEDQMEEFDQTTWDACEYGPVFLREMTDRECPRFFFKDDPILLP